MSLWNIGLDFENILLLPFWSQTRMDVKPRRTVRMVQRHLCACEHFERDETIMFQDPPLPTRIFFQNYLYLATTNTSTGKHKYLSIKTRHFPCVSGGPLFYAGAKWKGSHFTVTRSDPEAWGQQTIVESPQDTPGHPPGAICKHRAHVFILK